MIKDDAFKTYEDLGHKPLGVYRKLLFCIRLSDFVGDKSLLISLNRIKEKGLNIPSELLALCYINDLVVSPSVVLRLNKKIELSNMDIKKEILEIENILDTAVFKYRDKLGSFLKDKNVSDIIVLK